MSGMSGEAVSLAFKWVIIGACIGFGPVWILTSVWWFQADRGVRPLTLRVWRALTWLPLTIRNVVRWGRP